jgi:hypothetical protein
VRDLRRHVGAIRRQPRQLMQALVARALAEHIAREGNIPDAVALEFTKERGKREFSAKGDDGE